MKRNIVVISICLGLISLVGCTRKDYAENITEAPIFKAGGKINGQTFEIAAGQNGCTITSTKITDPFGYPQFISSLSPGNCNNCGPSLTFILRDDYRMEENNDSSSILAATQIPFMHRQPDNSGLNYLLQAENTSFYFCEWVLGQKPIGNGGTISQTFDQSGLQEISLRLHNGGELSYVITSTVDVGGTNIVAQPFVIEVMSDNHWKLRPASNLHDGLVAIEWLINGEAMAPNEIIVASEENAVFRLNYHNSISNQNGYYQIEVLENENYALPPTLNIYFKGEHEQREMFAVKYIDAAGRKYNSINALNIHRVLYQSDLGTSSDQELRLLRFDADLLAEDDTTVRLELRDFEVRTGFQP